MKAITPVIAIIILMLITMAIVGAGYGFISGVFTAVTSKAVFVNAQASCGIDRNITIYITNTGNGNINLTPASGDIIIERIQGPATTPVFTGSPQVIAPGELGALRENGSGCGEFGEQTCLYTVIVGGTPYPARADCL